MNKNKINIYGLITLLTTIIYAIVVSIFHVVIVDMGEGLVGIFLAWITAGIAVFTLFAKSKQQIDGIFSGVLASSAITFALTLAAPAQTFGDIVENTMIILATIEIALFICETVFVSLYKVSSCKQLKK